MLELLGFHGQHIVRNVRNAIRPLRPLEMPPKGRYVMHWLKP